MFKRRSNAPVLQQVPSEEALRQVGDVLREQREARGENLHDVAAYLRIRPGYLEALERGDLGAIPGRPYAIGFLRTYGTYLGLDAAAMVDHLKGAVGGRLAAQPDLVYREPLSESRRPTAALVFASLMVVGALYGGYYLISQGSSTKLEQVARVDGEIGMLTESVLTRDPLPRASSPAPVVVAAAPAAATAGTSTTASSPGAAGPPVALSAREDTSGPATAAAAPSTTGVDGTTVAAAESRAGAAPTLLAAAMDSERRAQPEPAAAESRLVLLARETTWVQVRSADREFVRTRTMEAGERLTLPDRDDLALWTGNAGGLEIVVEGRSTGPVGSQGAVLKNVSLARDELQARLPAAR